MPACGAPPSRGLVRSRSAVRDSPAACYECTATSGGRHGLIIPKVTPGRSTTTSRSSARRRRDSQVDVCLADAGLKARGPPPTSLRPLRARLAGRGDQYSPPPAHASGPQRRRASRSTPPGTTTATFAGRSFRSADRSAKASISRSGRRVQPPPPSTAPRPQLVGERRGGLLLVQGECAASFLACALHPSQGRGPGASGRPPPLRLQRCRSSPRRPQLRPPRRPPRRAAGIAEDLGLVE